MKIWVLSAMLLLVGVCFRVSDADVIFLKNGGKVTGDLVESESGSSDSYLVAIAGGGMVKLSRDQVARVVTKSEAERQYDEQAPKVPDTVEAHFAMAQWCLSKRLKSQRSFHLEQVIRLDPDHEDARHGLGYSKVGRRWVRKDEWLKKQGYIYYKGTWRLQQEVMLEQQREKVETAEKQWYKQLRIWNRWIDKDRHDEAVANIKAIQDPAAAAALAKLLEDEERIHMKVVYIDVLGRLKSSKATKALMELAIEDSSRRIRDDCLEQLEKQGTRSAAAYFLVVLSKHKGSVRKNNDILNRAGIALGRMGDKEAIQPLIDALVTEHIVVPGSSGGPGLGRIGVGFGSNGGGTFSAGNNSKPVKQKFQNQDVLYGLKALTGQDFRFDQKAWKAWLVESSTPKDVNLRRDE